MKIKAITNYLLAQYPLSLQEEWDESGFLNKGNINGQTNKVFVCLDLTNKTIDEAIKQKANLIVSHHPIFVNNDSHKLLPYYSKLVGKIKKHKLTVLSLHTCFDNSNIGMNFLVGTKLHLSNLKWYKKSKFVTGSFSKSLSMKEIAKKFKTIFNLSLITTNVDLTAKYKKLAICAGAGLSVFAEKYDELSKENILLITGDIKYHGWQDLSNYNIPALDVGHDLENCFCDFMASLIKQKFNKLTVYSISTIKKEKAI